MERRCGEAAGTRAFVRARVVGFWASCACVLARTFGKLGSPGGKSCTVVVASSAGTPLVAMASRSLSSGPLPLPVLSIHPKQASDEPCSLRARNMRKAFSMRDADTAEAAHGQGGGTVREEKGAPSRLRMSTSKGQST